MFSICHFRSAYFWVFLSLGFLYSCQEKLIDYSTQVKPILNKRCISCHGGVKKQGGFSLLFEDEAKVQLKSGKFGIIPGQPGKSEMIRRLTLEHEDERMPFEADPLPQEEIDILTKWVKQGAVWGEHWAYQPVEEPHVPEMTPWAKTEIDAYIEAKAIEQGLSVSEQAESGVLARRLALDLIGFPAPDSIKNIFLKQPDDRSYEKYVDALLDSDHFGEKWASMWMDLSRYADTKGYERDSDRNIWRYRDWLIKAFNKDMPYDKFITSQLAGDLLPDADESDYLATAFHRNTMTNDEGGTDNEEFRVAAVLDRVNTSWEALMSTSFACVQCHSHPYDPIRHEDYYRFMAYFNNTRDNDAYAEYPVWRHFDSTQIQVKRDFESWAMENLDEKSAKDIKHFIQTYQPSINSLETDHFVNSELADTKWLAMRNHSTARLPQVSFSGNRNLIFKYNSRVDDGKLTLRLDKANGPVLGEFQIPGKTKGWELAETDLQKVEGKHDLYFEFHSSDLKDSLKTGIQFDWFHFNSGGFKSFPKAQKTSFLSLLDMRTEDTPIMLDNVNEWSRKSHIFERGSWLSQGEEVQPGVPQVFEIPGENFPANRLGMAQWMTHPSHPLTSRTAVNRIWEQLFGRGLVETLEDLGSQGSTPSHRELLDYLAFEFMHTDEWSMKKLIKKIVLSATYRQDSKLSPEQLEADRFNIYLARGPRVRLSAEQVRDQALALSGVMNEQLYGPSVMPYQPEGVWLSPYNGKKWIVSEGNQKYRRALYTFWKRTAPYPSMMNFDGVGREVCTARRINTNTPLQALTTLNDPVYLDLARHFAEKVKDKEAGVSISRAYEEATGRKIDETRAEAFRSLYVRAKNDFKDMENPDLEAMAMVTNAIYNLDEVIMKY